jgi:hypothetical protein
MICDIDTALSDPLLLGAAIGDPAPWATWRIILKAAFGLRLDKSEARILAKVSGGRKPPRKRVQELWVIAGRRGGKSRMAAAVSAYIAGFDDHRGKLAPGETGFVLAVAPSKSQARTIRDYTEGFFDQSAILRQQVDSTSTEEIRLNGNVTIGVHTNSFRTVRGRTLLAAVLEEVAFMRDDASAAPDIELYRAILPALATTGGMLIGISSPYRKVGLLHQKFRDHFGVEDPDVLVIKAPTETLNPTINKKVIANARKSDPESALAEWDAEFRGDLSSLLDDAVIDSAIENGRPLELPPRPGVTYNAFVDASAGRHDHFTIGIGHREGDRFVADVIRGRKPPFDPKEVVVEFTKLAREYRCREVIGDNYAGEWVAGAFKEAGISYKRSELPKSGLYLEMVPTFMRGAVSIPNHPLLVRELRLLERRTSRSGRDAVDHPQNGSDDYSNALAGVLNASVKPRNTTTIMSLDEAFAQGRQAWDEAERRRRHQ